MEHKADKSQAPGPLSGTTVIDVTMGLAGPYASFLLAAMGARVIKIELPVAEGQFLPARSTGPFIGKDGLSFTRRNPDDLSISFLQRMRGLEAISLDMKKPGGREVFLDLVAKSDIVVQNLSRGAIDRLGCGYAAGNAVNPRIIYTSITGTGQDDRSGSGKTYDTVIQALSGMMMTSGVADQGPVLNGLPIADLVTPLYGVIGTLAALNEAQRTGRGQHIDVSMLGAITTLVANDVFDELQHLGIPSRKGNTIPRFAPLGVFPAADGHVAFCTISDDRFREFARAAGMPELIDDPRFATRAERTRNHREMDDIVASWTKTLPATEVAAVLDKVGVPAAEVRSTYTALRDPRVRVHGDVVPLRHPVHGATHEIYGPGIPIKFGERSYPVDAVVPAPGENNESVYAGLLEYPADKIARLKAGGVI